MLEVGRSVYFLFRHVQELQGVCEKLIIAQPVRDIIRIGIGVLTAVCRELFPQFRSDICFKILKILHTVPTLIDPALDTGEQQAAVLVINTGHHRELLRAFRDLRLDGAHLVQIWNIHVRV